eukprot:scaffold157902_cov17-Tisochrysis_lutea.AAC.2
MEIWRSFRQGGCAMEVEGEASLRPGRSLFNRVHKEQKKHVRLLQRVCCRWTRVAKGRDPLRLIERPYWQLLAN